uniref:Uncharacterized protein n=1 Tax=Glossina pallidipes TaxID=7398 RepID=A0A1B0A1U1_GLOPL
MELLGQPSNEYNSNSNNNSNNKNGNDGSSSSSSSSSSNTRNANNKKHHKERKTKLRSSDIYNTKLNKYLRRRDEKSIEERMRNRESYGWVCCDVTMILMIMMMMLMIMTTTTTTTTTTIIIIIVIIVMFCHKIATKKLSFTEKVYLPCTAVNTHHNDEVCALRLPACGYLLFSVFFFGETFLNDVYAIPVPSLTGTKSNFSEEEMDGYGNNRPEKFNYTDII